jgi:hypothetical protein
MKVKLVARLMLFSLLTSIIAITAKPANAANGNVQLYVNPPEVNEIPSHVDSFFDVFVEIANVTDLFGFDIRLTWDISLITLASAEYTSYINALWPGGYQVVFNETYVGGGGGGGYKLVALSTSSSFTKDPGSQVLFPMHFKIVKGCNFLLATSIHFDLAKLSDKNYAPILATKTDGQYNMAATTPDIEFELIDPNPIKPYEICKIFYVKVYVTHICAQLKDYDLTILYDSILLNLTAVDWTGGVLGGESDQASYTGGYTSGTIRVIDTGGIIWSGDRGLLFTLVFHVEFDDREEHIWRVGSLHELPAQISFQDATLSFVEGSIPMSGIAMPSALHLTIQLIQGDVDCNGIVDVWDIRTVAYFYDQTQPAKYDLTNDGTIDVFDLVVVGTNFNYGT